MGTKLRPLLITVFSAFESGRFSGNVTTYGLMVLVFERCCPVFSSIREVF